MKETQTEYKRVFSFLCCCFLRKVIRSEDLSFLVKNIVGSPVLTITGRMRCLVFVNQLDLGDFTAFEIKQVGESSCL